MTSSVEEIGLQHSHNVRKDCSSVTDATHLGVIQCQRGNSVPVEGKQSCPLQCDMMGAGNFSFLKGDHLSRLHLSYHIQTQPFTLTNTMGVPSV